jgi:membrane protease YdiL (CAAX protease family)
VTEARPTTTFFFAFALGWTLVLQLPAALARLGVIDDPSGWTMNLLGLGVFGPILGAVVAAWREGGRTAAKAVFWPITRGYSPIWIGVALLICPLLVTLGCGVARALGVETAIVYGPENAQQIAGLVMMPFVEEPGWRGYALPRLVTRHGSLRASFIVGALWAVWHTMMFIVQWGPSPMVFALGIANILGGSVIFSWLFARTRGSLLIAYVAHVGAHLDSPAHALPEHPAPFTAYTIAVTIAAVVLVLFDRDAWRNAPAT